jgi:hypothetical protein
VLAAQQLVDDAHQRHGGGVARSRQGPQPQAGAVQRLRAAPGVRPRTAPAWVGECGDLRRGDQALPEALGSTVPAGKIGQAPAGDAERQGSSLVGIGGHLRAPAPRDQEGLGRDVEGVLPAYASAQGVAQHGWAAEP